MKITYSGNILSSSDYQIKFEHEIRMIIALSDKTLVLLSIPETDEATIDNIYAISKDGDIIWRSESLRDVYPKELNLPYEYMEIDTTAVQATDFYGRRYYLDIDNGKITQREIMK